MKLRPAQLEDSAGLAQIQVDSYRRAYAGIMPQDYLDQFSYEEQEQDWRELLSSEMEDILYVAEADDGEIAGYALGRPGLSEIPPYDSELVSLHVRGAQQGKGVGQQLVAAVAAQLWQRGCRSLMLWVLEKNPARSFYEQLGGQLLKESQLSGAGAPEVAYGWPDIENLYRSP